MVAEAEAIARKIDLITAELGPRCRELGAEHGHTAMVMALAKLGAAHALHDGASIEDYTLVAKVAYQRVATSHGT